jgi:DNA-directed RNA polymerase subunit M/transcription elongation factor TFIIS
MLNDITNRTIICPKCNKHIYISLGQLTWNKTVKCSECDYEVEINNGHSTNIELNNKYNILMK